jgi:hypothetical protein
MVIKMSETIYIIEFKVDGSNALAQIKEMKYHEQYLSDGRDMYLIGLEFDTKEKNVSKVEWEKIGITGVEINF